MKSFDIFITFISWDGGGKSRPVLAYIVDSANVMVYQITTQYDNKSDAIKAKYFKIVDWKQAGLAAQSYIDAGTLLKLPIATILGKAPIGELSADDKRRLIDFVNKAR